MASTPPHKAVAWMLTYAEVCYIDPLHVNSVLTYADVCLHRRMQTYAISKMFASGKHYEKSIVDGMFS